MKLFNLEMDSTVFKSGIFLTKFGNKSSPKCCTILTDILVKTELYVPLKRATSLLYVKPFFD